MKRNPSMGEVNMRPYGLHALLIALCGGLSGAIPSVANLDPVCENYQSLPSQGGRMGCILHETPQYPEGCRRFPANPKQWYRVAESCGYWFEWVEDKPRRAGKARRRRARR